MGNEEMELRIVRKSAVLCGESFSFPGGKVKRKYRLLKKQIFINKTKFRKIKRF